MIGALLGHSQPTTTARYAHLIGTPLHEAVDTIGGKLLAAMQTQPMASYEIEQRNITENERPRD